MPLFTQFVDCLLAEGVKISKSDNPMLEVFKRALAYGTQKHRPAKVIVFAKLDEILQQAGCNESTKGVRGRKSRGYRAFITKTSNYYLKRFTGEFEMRDRAILELLYGCGLRLPSWWPDWEDMDIKKDGCSAGKGKRSVLFQWKVCPKALTVGRRF